VAPGGIGELLYRGPSVMKGYWNQPEATAETLQDGWLHTGDLVRVDADGYMTVVDRLKDVILTGGRNVYSQEVERVLARHEAIADCAVVARAHPIYGESIVAVVTAADPASPPDLASVRAHCREGLADYKVPHDLVVLDALPRNAGGKVLKRELRALVAEPLGRAR
jgi:fatty-acyl-CoA synthase